MKVALFGPNGYIGQSLQLMFKNQGFECLGFSSKNSTGLLAETGLLSDKFDVQKLRDCDCLIYLSHSPYYPTPESHVEHLMNVNAVSPVIIAKKCLEVGLKRFIYFSTSSVYHRSWTPIAEDDLLNENNIYSNSKIQGELGLQNLLDLDLTILRPFYVYGPGQQDKLIPELKRRILSNEEVFLDSNTYDQDGIELSFLFIDDLTKMVLEILLMKLTGTFNLASPESLSIRQLTLMLANMLDRQARFKSNNIKTGNFISDNQKTYCALKMSAFTSLEEGLAGFLIDEKRR